MEYTRRELGQLALAALPAAAWIGNSRWHAEAAGQTAKSNANVGGVEVGLISYSFRQISYKPEDIIKGMNYLGLTVLELEQSFFEQYLGAPRDPTGGGQPGGVGSVPAGGPFGNAGAAVAPAPTADPAGAARGAAGAPGARGTGGGGRGAPRTPEQEAALAAVRAELKKWRLSAPWDKVRALRKLLSDGGVDVRLVKFPQLGGPEMADEEVDYCFQFAKTMGARALTCEPPLSAAKRVARFADKHKTIVGYHNHSNVTSVEAFGRTGAWEQAFFYSKHNWANVDIGHFTAGNGHAPTDFIREYHDRITNLHLKDRKINGPNVPWGEGDTPIKETLQLMKREKYTFPAMIELEYPIPAGSTVMDELKKCVQYCRDALG